jgi:predicted aspartyl protease
MITYNDDFDPPAPVLPITVAGVVRSRLRIDTIALIDTGSDITAIPSELADGLQLYPFGRVQIEDVSSKKTPVLTYAVRLTIANLPMQEVEVILTR